MKKITVILWVISVVITIASGILAETVPSYINYQGNLTDKNGAVTGKHKLQFKIYTDSHDIKGSNDVQNDGRPTLTGPGTGWTESTESKGGGAAHNNMQPFFVLNYIIKY